MNQSVIIWKVTNIIEHAYSYIRLTVLYLLQAKLNHIMNAICM